MIGAVMSKLLQYYGGPADGSYHPSPYLQYLRKNAVLLFWFYGESYIYKFDGTRLIFVEKNRT